MSLHEFACMAEGLRQCCPTRGPRAACGPPTDFMRPASAG